MKTLFLILISIKLNAQITTEQDLTLDYYRGLGVSWVSAEIANHYTKKPFLSGLIGAGIGTAQCFLDRGSRGRIISTMGASTGIIFCYPIRLDYGRKKQEKLNKIKYERN